MGFPRLGASGGWQTGVGRSLGGKTIGIIGLGKQGRQVARFANAFQMNVLAWSRSLTDAQYELHTACLDQRGLIGAPQFGLMKESALLVNTSRGPIVNEAALINAMQNGRIAGAAIDVYDIEPLPPDHPIRTLPNTLLTPHTGYVTEENLVLMYTQAIEDIVAWLDGDPQRVLNG